MDSLLKILDLAGANEENHEELGKAANFLLVDLLVLDVVLTGLQLLHARQDVCNHPFLPLDPRLLDFFGELYHHQRAQAHKENCVYEEDLQQEGREAHIEPVVELIHSHTVEQHKVDHNQGKPQNYDTTLSEKLASIHFVLRLLVAWLDGNLELLVGRVL